MLEETITARYENTNDIGIAVVAVLTHDHLDRLLDWTAYIGASTNNRYESAAVAAAAKFGNKLSQADAHYYFPSLPLEKYRL